MRRALFVGVDEYGDDDPLKGCVADATRMRDLLLTHEDGSPNFDQVLLTCPAGGDLDTVTRPVLKREIDTLLRTKAEVLLLYFAGHGTENDLGGYLVTQDAEEYDDGVSMSEILKKANNSPADEVVIIIDCCHSGHLGDAPIIQNETALLTEGISILTASRRDQESVEIDQAGLFTSLVADALEGGGADVLGSVTAASIYAYVEGALGSLDPRPLFKSHVDRLTSLRKCEPHVPLEILRRLHDLFPLPAEDFPLDPTYESSSPVAIDAHVEVMDELQCLYRAHLVVPVDCTHMFEAATESHACRLTPTGRYYWRRAQEGRI